MMWNLPKAPGHLPSSHPLSGSSTAKTDRHKTAQHTIGGWLGGWLGGGGFWTKAAVFVTCKHDEKEDSECRSDMFPREANIDASHLLVLSRVSSEESPGFWSTFSPNNLP